MLTIMALVEREPTSSPIYKHCVLWTVRPKPSVRWRPLGRIDIGWFTCATYFIGSST